MVAASGGGRERGRTGQGVRAEGGRGATRPANKPGGGSPSGVTVGTKRRTGSKKRLRRQTTSRKAAKEQEG